MQAKGEMANHAARRVTHLSLPAGLQLGVMALMRACMSFPASSLDADVQENKIEAKGVRYPVSHRL
jgi:hypothetical protein